MGQVVSLGQGDGAGNGSTEDRPLRHLERGLRRAAPPSAPRLPVAYERSGGTIGGGLTHGATFNHFDAFSRYDRIRYDTPALGPVTLAVSAGQADRVRRCRSLESGYRRWSDQCRPLLRHRMLRRHWRQEALRRLYRLSVLLRHSACRAAYAENEPSELPAVGQFHEGQELVPQGRLQVGQQRRFRRSYGESKDAVCRRNSASRTRAFRLASTTTFRKPRWTCTPVRPRATSWISAPCPLGVASLSADDIIHRHGGHQAEVRLKRSDSWTGAARMTL